MKKGLRILLLTFLVAMLMASFAYANDDEAYYDGDYSTYGIFLGIDSKKILVANYYAIQTGYMSTAPIILNGRTYLPISEIVWNLEGELEWDADTKKISATLGDREVEFYIDNPNAKVNGKSVKMDVPAKIINGRTMVPLRFVGESLGLQVDWNSKHKVISIYYPFFKDEMWVDEEAFGRWFKDGNGTAYDMNGDTIRVGDFVHLFHLFGGEVMEIDGATGEVVVLWHAVSRNLDIALSGDYGLFDMLDAAGIDNLNDYQTHNSRDLSIVRKSDRFLWE